MRNFQKYFWERFQNFKEAPALYTIEDGRRQTTTFWEWTRRIQNLAMALMDHGFEAGTRVGFVAPNGRDWIDMAMATWLVGGVIVPLVPGRTRAETLRCLGRSGCDWIAVADDAQRGRLRGPGGELPDHLRWIFFDDDTSDDKTFPVDELESAGRGLIRRGHTKKLAKRIYGLEPDDPCLILFEPEPGPDAQGAFFSGQKVAYQLKAVGDQMGITGSDDVAVGSMLSFGWFSSFLICASTLYAGKSVVLGSSLRDLSEELEILKPTHLVCGPAYLEKLAARWKQRIDDAPELLKRLAGTDDGDTSTMLRTLALGSVGERAARKFLYDPIQKEFGGRLEAIEVFEGRCPVGLHPLLDNVDIALLGHFGLPEAGITHLQHPGARRPNAAGRPIEGVATKIEGAKTGEVGELCVRGDTIFDGYWAGDGPRKVDEHGWLHTGRQARLESGFLFLEDLS